MIESESDSEIESVSEIESDSEIGSDKFIGDFAGSTLIKKDHRLYDQARYESLYSWLYYKQSAKGYMCKICDVYYGVSPCPSGGNRGAWSHKAVTFHDNAGKKLRRHEKSKLHSCAVKAMTNLRIEETLGNADNDNENRHEVNNLYIRKLIRCVHFLARNNLSVKALYPKLIDFLANEIQEPIIKQYLECCPKNATYKSHETCDSLLDSLDTYFRQSTEKRIRRATDLVLFADESSNAARSEMLGIFISTYNEQAHQFHMDFVSIVEVSSTSSEIVMEAVVKVLQDRDIDIKKTRFSCFDGTNSMSGIHNGVQRRVRNYAPHAIYINCRCHRLALCFKHLMDTFPWLLSVDSLLLGLWKTFHFSSKNRFILREIQQAYGMKSLKIVKAAVTRWLSHGVACKRCRERYDMILGALDDIITKAPKPELIGYRDQLLETQTILQITFLEDVLSVTNTLSLVLQSDRKDFGAVRRALNSTLSVLKDMAADINSIHLTSFHLFEDVLENVESFAKQNLVSTRKRKAMKIDKCMGFEQFHSNVGKPFLSALAGKYNFVFLNMQT